MTSSARRTSTGKMGKVIPNLAILSAKSSSDGVGNDSLRPIPITQGIDLISSEKPRDKDQGLPMDQVGNCQSG